MPIYKVRVHYTCHEDLEVEALDKEDAEEKACEQSNDVMNLADSLEVTECDVELSDCQYTAQQELEDRER